MAQNLEVLDNHLDQQLSQLETFKQNSQRLQLETFKVQSFLSMFNNCADRCQLQYRESGIKAPKGGELPQDVECFTHCIEKSYQVSKLAFQ